MKTSGTRSSCELKNGCDSRLLAQTRRGRGLNKLVRHVRCGVRQNGNVDSDPSGHLMRMKFDRHFRPESGCLRLFKLIWHFSLLRPSWKSHPNELFCTKSRLFRVLPTQLSTDIRKRIFRPPYLSSLSRTIRFCTFLPYTPHSFPQLSIFSTIFKWFDWLWTSFQIIDHPKSFPPILSLLHIFLFFSAISASRELELLVYPTSESFLFFAIRHGVPNVVASPNHLEDSFHQFNRVAQTKTPPALFYFASISRLRSNSHQKRSQYGEVASFRVQLTVLLQPN